MQDKPVATTTAMAADALGRTSWSFCEIVGVKS